MDAKLPKSLVCYMGEGAMDAEPHWMSKNYSSDPPPLDKFLCTPLCCLAMVLLILIFKFSMEGKCMTLFNPFFIKRTSVVIFYICDFFIIYLDWRNTITSKTK